MKSTSPLSSRYSPDRASSPGLGKERPLSPNRIRVTELGTRFAELQANLESEKINKTESFDYKIKQLEDTITRNHYNIEDNLRDLKHHANKLNEGVSGETVAREILDDRKTNEIRLIEKNVVLDLNAEKQNRKETEQKLLQKVEEKISALSLDVAKEQRKEDEIITKQTKEVVSQLVELKESLENEKMARQENSEKLARRLEEEVQRIEVLVNKERKAREQSENTLFKTLEEISGRIQAEINIEKNSRSKAHEQILSLLEETCNKIESQLKYR